MITITLRPNDDGKEAPALCLIEDDGTLLIGIRHGKHHLPNDACPIDYNGVRLLIAHLEDWAEANKPWSLMDALKRMQVFQRLFFPVATKKADDSADAPAQAVEPKRPDCTPLPSAGDHETEGKEA